MIDYEVVLHLGFQHEVDIFPVIEGFYSAGQIEGPRCLLKGGSKGCTELRSSCWMRD